MAVHSDEVRNVTTGTRRTRSERIEVRTTPDDRASSASAVAASDTDLTSFVMTSLTVAARRVLADRAEFALDAEDETIWEAVNERPPRDLPGV